MMADTLSGNVRALHQTLSSRSPHRGSQAAQLASDLYQLCIESVSDTELANCTAVLFNKSSGILSFLRDSAAIDEFATAQEELLRLLGNYIKLLQASILPHTVEVKDVCCSLFSRAKSSKVKNATFPPQIAVLELCAGSSQAESLNIPKLVDKYHQACLKPTKHSATVRASIFHLMGLFCELYPEHMMNLSERLIGIFMRTLKAEMVSKTKKPEMSVIGGCLRGLCSYLTNFSQSVAEGSEYSQDIYKYTRMAIDPKVSHSRYEVPRAGLSLISKHAAQFKEYLAKDSEHMYNVLFEWCGHNNRENKQLAFLALEAFLEQVSIQVMEGAQKDKQLYGDLFLNFIKKFRVVIDNPASKPRQLAVAIKGYGFFATPCKFFKPSEINFMFNEMIQRSEQLFFSTSGTAMEDKLLHLPAFLEALASIVKEMDQLSETFLGSLEKLVVLLFECFPHIPPTNHKPTYYSVVRLILGVSKSRTAIKRFLSHIVYQGLIRTCSHPVVVDVGDGTTMVAVDGGGGEEATAVGGKPPPSYLDYIQLWQHLMDPTKLRNLQLRDSSTRVSTHTLLYDEVISSVLKIIGRLDLSAVVALSGDEEEEPLTTSTTSPPSSIAESSTAHLVPVTGLLPAVPKDFQIFINLVDLCKSLLLKVPPDRFGHWVLTFGREVIVESSQFPLVSGFYKLLATALALCRKIHYFEGVQGGEGMEVDVTDQQACFLLFRKFIREVLVRMKQYKDDLLVSCLQLLLSLPNELVEPELANIVPALQSTFKLGLSYIPLAHTGLDALQYWSSQLPPSLLNPHLRHILPYLDDYLKTSGYTESHTEGGTLTIASSSKGRRVPVRAIAKWKEGIEGAESPQNKIRSRIVYFLGSLGGEGNAGLVESESAAAYAAKAVAWDAKNHLELALPFQDLKPTIFLDPFLPRVCELASSSSDRQTKIAACELLHAVLLFTIARSAQPAMQSQSPMTKLFRKLFPHILRLACDVEKVAEQLFHPIVFQMIHWFTRNTQYESPNTIALLDAILDGIVDSSNTSLRDFCGQCIREFLVWSIKQTSKKQQESSPINIKSLLKRLYSLASHPSASKRLGAALAFNNIYAVFREEQSLVDVFLVEMLVVMIYSLTMAHRDDKGLGTQEQCMEAIGHLARIVKVKSSLLNTTNKNRRIPKGLNAADLFSVVRWLFVQCGSPETACREQCRKLFLQLAPLLPKMASARTWIRRTMESERGFYFVSRFEMGGITRGGILSHSTLKGKVFSLAETTHWLESLLAALECYNWALGEQLVSPSEVFLLTPTKPSEKPSSLFKSLKQFTNNLSLHGIEAAVQCFETTPTSIHTPREVLGYNHIRSSVTSALLKFVTTLLTRHPNEAFSHVPKFFWSETLLQLVATSCLRPTAAGFDISDVRLIEKLSTQALDCLKSMATHLPPEKRSTFLECLKNQLAPNGPCDLAGQLPLTLFEEDSSRDHSHLDTVLHGHLLLQRADLLMPALEEIGHSRASLVSRLLDSVLAAVKPLLSTTSKHMATLSPADQHSTSLLLELALLIGTTPASLVDLLLDKSTGCPGLGVVVLQSYPQQLSHHLVSQYDELLGLLLKEGIGKVDTVLILTNPESVWAKFNVQHQDFVSALLNGLLDHIGRDKTLWRGQGTGVAVCSYLLSQWSQLSGWWQGEFNTDHRLGAVSLLRKLLNLEPKLLQKAPPTQTEAVVSMYLTLLDEPQATLVFKITVLELLQYFLVLSEDHTSKVKSSLNKLIASQFPLKSSEFIVGSPQYNEYISAIDKLLLALVASGSPVLLEVIVMVMCREQRHAHEDRIQDCLVRFITEIPTSLARKAAIDAVYKLFTNERDYPLEGRRAVAERVCLTLLRSCDEATLREFFLDHVVEIMSTVEEKLSSKSGLESQLVGKVCCFQFMELLYIRLPTGALSSPDSNINKTYCKGTPKTGKEMTQTLTKVGHQAKGEDLHGDTTLGELRRQYHCAAFNMVSAVISCTQKDMKFYTTFLFKEDLNKGMFLWDNLMDYERVYHFETELETPIDRKKKLTAIRNEPRSPDSRESSPLDSPLFSPRYLSSQYLADSSLSTDVSQFDFSGGPQVLPRVRVSSQSEMKETSYTVSEEQIEQDELNLHECMLPLMRLLDHMQHNNITPSVPEGSVAEEMPQWMVCIHKKMLETRTQHNVKLLLVRLIINRPKIFQPYARFWLPCIMQFLLNSRHSGDGMNYFVVDAVVTMLSWASTATPDDSQLASRLLEYLMQNCHHDNRSVFRNNLEIIKTLTELWRDRLQPPTKVIYNHFCNPSPDSKSNRTGIQLLGVVVANHFPPYEGSTAGAIDEQRFYQTFVSLMGHKYKDSYAASAEILGMILAYLDEKQHPTYSNLLDVVTKKLLSLSAEGNEDKFLICLNKIQINFSKLVERFVEKVLFVLPTLHGVFRSMCLEVIQSQADIRPTLYQELKGKGFHDMLKFRDEPTQLASLKICQSMIQCVSQEQLSELLPYLRAFSSHSSQPCRMLMYDILIWVYNNTCDGSETTDASLKSFMSEVREQLLQGLADEAESIRLKMFAFWNQESRLASSTLGRLAQLLAVLYSTGTERHFLFHSTNLLLELTSRSPDFNRSMFDQPLSECKFEEYTGIDLSWRQRYSQMTPLFAASLASQPGQTQTDGGPGAPSSVGAGMLRATQKSLAFTPTQEGEGYNWMTPSLQSLEPSFTPGSSTSVGGPDSTPSGTETTQSSLLFKLGSMKPPKHPLRAVVPGDGFGKGRLGVDETDSGATKEDQRKEIMKLKRRFLKDRNVTSKFFAKTTARKNIQREEFRKHQKAARESRVVMYRKYRLGDLPDVQIKYSEIIRPFQALAQRDSALAKMLFASLYRSLFALVERELSVEEAEATITAIRDGLNAVLEASTDCFAPFVGSIQSVCFHENRLVLDPTAVSTTCLFCMQEPIGVLLLEKQLLVSEEATSSERPAKRQRGAASVPSDTTTTTWVQMARLYKSMGDYDTLRGIFSGHIGVKKITKEALMAEERVDYLEALRLYKEAVGCEGWSDGEPSQVEEDHWDDSMMECYSHLTDWKDLEKAATVNIEGGKLDKIWDDPYCQDHYLPHLIRAKLKLACSEVEDPTFSEFLSSALRVPERKGLLESRHSTELALYSILCGELDRASYYTGICLQSFLQDWAHLDDLLEKSRSHHLQQLQLLTEIREFLQFMGSPANFESSSPFHRLLGKWGSRFPHPQLDPLSVWDDIITSRCMFMRKILEHFSTHSSSADGGAGESMEVDGGGVSVHELQEECSREYISLYLRMADTARHQSNYPVCRKYLQLTEQAIKNFFPTCSELHLSWLHGVAEMKLQQAERDPSPINMEPLVTLLDRIETTEKGFLSGDHSLTRSHRLIEGRAFSVLAQTFQEKESGELMLSFLNKSRAIQLNKMIGMTSAASPSVEEISHKLLVKSLSALKSATKSGTAEMKATSSPEGMVEALMEMAMFCDRSLRRLEGEDSSPLDTEQFPSVVVTYSLKAMKFGSRKAIHQFPRLLQLLDLYPATLKDFKKKCCEVPEWMFIGWISQMIALMDKPEGEGVEQILTAIATKYPQALCYPFKISSTGFKCEDTDDGRKRRAAIHKLAAQLDSKLVTDFVSALEQLDSPELAWKDLLENHLHPVMEQSAMERDPEEVERQWQHIYAQLLDLRLWEGGQSTESSVVSSTGGTVSMYVGQRRKRFARDNLKKIEQKFGKDGKKLLQMKTNEYKTVCGRLYEGMREQLNRSSGAGLLKDYSPWLSSFQPNQYNESLEIPGQYDGKSEPLPEYHVKIAGFDEKVLVIGSLRKPKRLTVRGDDEKEHMFLVKAGEDLRADQRIEQVFEVMNEALYRDAPCSQRGLKLRTYSVVPMTARVGMIEWMENTKPFKEFMQSALTSEERKHFANGMKWHSEWMKKYGENTILPVMYRKMYRQAKRSEVEKEYRKKVTTAPWDMLRRAFFQLSSSPEAFLALRSHFVQTLATLSVCHYVLGIGDRHLSNFMVDMETGGAVGIDFGHAFGTATQFLPIPELLPFRLTPQIKNLLLPHSESGQLCSCMVHSLRALRNSHELLLNTMDVFVKEPSLEWKSNARKQAKAQKLDMETYSQDGSWYPAQKIEQAQKKLMGHNPAHVMRIELKWGHAKLPEYSALEAILMGDKRYCLRARVGEVCSSVEEQVACLIDQATDPNILGRTYQGWEPWV